MEFTSASLLWALPVAAIPMIIYLLFRWRRRDVEWGSIYVLRRVLETKSRLRAWLQYLVVALRTATLIALVLALAGLVGRRRPTGADDVPAAPPATHRVVLLDNSASMAARHEGSTRLEAAINLCRKLVRAGRSPGRLDLVPLAGRQEPLVFESFPVAAGRIEELLSAVAVPAGPADFAAGLRRAAEIFRGSAAERRELFIASDFAAGNFAGGREADDVAVAAAAMRDAGVAVHAIRYQAPRTANFSVVELTPHADLLLAEQPTLFHATVDFSGSVPDGETVLAIEADPGTPEARVLHEEPLTMTSGEQVLEIALALPAGRQALRAFVRPDDLPADDSQTRVFTVADSLRVALVQDIQPVRGFDDPRTWLDLALAGGGSGPLASKAVDAVEAERGLKVSVEGTSPVQLTGDVLAAVDVVIVAGVERIEAAAVESLRRFAARGGLVLLAPRPGQDCGMFNASWRAITPAALESPRWPEVDPQRHESCVAESESSPLWAELESTAHGNLANARFYNYFRLAPGAGDEAAAAADRSEVLLSLGEGDPLLVERRIGRGGVMLWTAGLTHQWHSLVVHPGFPVMLLRLATLAADRARFATNVVVGEPLVMPTTVEQVKVIRPDGTAELVPTAIRGEARFVRYAATDLPGTYDVREDVESQRPGAVFTVARDDRGESNLTPVSAEQRQRLEAAAGQAWCDDDAGFAAVIAREYPGPSWALPVAVLMLASLLGEAAISRWLL